MARSTLPIQGILVHDARIKHSNISSSESSYTEAGPKPGTALAADACSKITPRVHGAQTNDLRVTCVRGGQPGPDTCGLGWRTSSETASDLRSWNLPCVLRGAEVVYFDPVSGGTLYTIKSMATVPDTQKVILVASTGSTGSSFNTWTYDPETRVWTDQGSTNLPGGSTGAAGLAMYWDESLCGMVLVVNDVGPYGAVLFSDDDGASWSTIAFDPMDTVVHTLPSVAGASAAVDQYGNVYLARAYTGRLQVHVSADHGATFIEQISETTLDVDYIDVTTNATGQIVVAYVDGTSSDVSVAVLGDAYESLVSATPSVITETATVVTCCTDADGIIYIAYVNSTDGSIRLARSTDGGASVEQLSRIHQPDVTTLQPENMVCTMSAGELILVCTWSNPSTTTTEGTITAMYCGGWDNVEHDTKASTGTTQVQRLGWVTSTDYGRTWPFVGEAPQNLGFTLAAGSGATGSSDGWNMTTSSATNYYSDGWTNGTPELGCVFEFRVNSGGALTSPIVGARINYDDTSTGTDNNVWINATTTGFRLYDFNATATLVDVTVDMTDFVQIMLYFDAVDSVTLWYRDPASDTWSGGNTYSLTANAVGTSAGSLDWGHISSGTADSDWKLIAVCEDKQLRHKAAGGTGYGGFRWGRGLDASPYPLRTEGDSSYRSRLSVAGGPAKRQDTFTINAAHDYGVDQLDPVISPSPKRAWRSTQTASDEYIVWDLGEDTRFQAGSYLSLCMIGEGIPNAALVATKPDGGAYTTRGNWLVSSGMTSQTYTLSGDIIYASGVKAASRFIHANELVGGYVILDPAGTPKLRKILHNSAGRWDGTGADSNVHIRLNGIDGTEASSGTVHICPPRGMMLMPFTSDAEFRYIKLEIDATNGAPDGYLTLGSIILGAVTIPGHGMSRGWSMRWIPQVDSREDSYGTMHTRKRAPLIREFTWSYQDLINTTALRNDVADYHSTLITGADNAIVRAERGDVHTKLAGVLMESRGGELPVAMLLDASDVTPSTTITDPTKFVAGTLTGTVQANHVVGTPGTNEAYRVESLTIREQPWDID